jgi:uncharacterized protein
VSADRRYKTIDLARGIALLGVALVNVHAIARGWVNHYALNLADHDGDVIAEFVVGLVFSHRSFPLLAFLFGVGIAMQWQRMDEASRSVRTLRMRYAALFVLGAIHALLLWPGDIVSTYALIALILLIRWRLSDRTLRILIGVFFALAFAQYALFAMAVAIADANLATVASPFPSSSSFALPSIVDAGIAHLKEYLFFGLSHLSLPEVWLAVVAGIYVGQTGALTRWLSRSSSGWPWFGIGFALLGVGSALELYGAARGGWSYGPMGQFGDAFMLLGLLPTMIGSVFAWLAIARAWDADTLPKLRNVRSLLIAAGRTPLTQFFGQSLVFAIIFNKSLIGWHGEMGRLAYSTVAVITFFLWAAFARDWLAAGHRRGPMEIVWLGLARKLSGGSRAE